MGRKFIKVLSKIHAVKFLLHGIRDTAAPSILPATGGVLNPFWNDLRSAVGGQLTASVFMPFGAGAPVPSGFPGGGDGIESHRNGCLPETSERALAWN